MKSRSLILAILLALCFACAGLAQSSGSIQLTLNVNPNPSTAGNPVTMTVTSVPALTGLTVQFIDGEDTIGSATLNNGIAQFITSTLAPGTHFLFAEIVQGSTGIFDSNTVQLNVLFSSTTTLTATPNPATVCDVVTLTSTVTGNVTGSFDVPPPGPTGFVTFFDG